MTPFFYWISQECYEIALLWFWFTDEETKALWAVSDVCQVIQMVRHSLCLIPNVFSAHRVNAVECGRPAWGSLGLGSCWHTLPRWALDSAATCDHLSSHSPWLFLHSIGLYQESGWEVSSVYFWTFQCLHDCFVIFPILHWLFLTFLLFCIGLTLCTGPQSCSFWGVFMWGRL